VSPRWSRERPARGRPDPEPRRQPPPERPRWALGPSLAVAVGVFAGVTLISWAAGAANLGVALGIGQIAFAIVLVAIMVWR
jgi:anti-sigma factor RsiW